MDGDDEEDIDVTVEDEPGETVEVIPEKVDEPEYTVDDLEGDSQQKIEKRRLSTKEKRERQREQRMRLEAKVKDLTAQTTEMQRRLQAAEGNQYGLRLEGINNRKEELKALYQQATEKLEEFETANDIKGVRQAIELRTRLDNEYRTLDGQEKQILQVANRPPPLNQSSMNYLKGWLDRNKDWYKTDLSNRDSRIADELSKDILQEGFTASQPEYWEELDRRCSDYIPTKRRRTEREPLYDDELPPQTVAGRGNQSRVQSGRQEVTIDSWTVQQWKNAGIWDDPKERSKAIKEYSRMMEKEKRHG